MKVDLLNYTPLEMAIKAIRMCYRSEGKSDNLGEKDKELIRRIVKSGHTSTVESISYVYQIEGVSRITLLQMERHRHISYSVESQRYVTQENADFIIPPTIKNMEYGELEQVYKFLDKAKELYNHLLFEGIPKEDARYFLPQGITTNLVMTINARSLRNFLQLRLDPKAQWEIRQLAENMFLKLPKEHRETIFYDIELEG